MPTVTTVKRRRLVNAGRRRRHNAKRRHLTPKQIRFFGTKRQRAALKNRSRRKHSARRNRGSVTSVARKAFRRGGEGTRSARYHYKAQSHARRRTMREESGMPVRRNRSRRRRRKHNVRSIVTVYPMHMNAGRRKNVAARRRRRHNARRHRRHNVVYQRKLARGRYAYTSRNAGRRRRRHNIHHRRRHNQGRVRRAGMALGGTATKVLSIIGGATVTKLISDLLPATFQTGVLGYLGVGVVAVAQGQLIGGLMRSSSVRENMTAGGLVYLTIKILNDFVPTLGGTLGLRGMGLIAPTQGFAVPLVNQGGSMGMFVRPGFVPAPYVPAASGALGSLQSIRRGGRVR